LIEAEVIVQGRSATPLNDWGLFNGTADALTYMTGRTVDPNLEDRDACYLLAVTVLRQGLL